MNEQNRRSRYRGSLLGPILLIAAGIIFLLSNLGLITGDIWDTLWRLWPVLLIAIGLDSLLRRSGLVGPTLLIGVGVVFLLSNYNVLALNVWDAILSLWPLLLIAIGFDIVIGRRSAVAAVIGMVVILAILAGAVWWGGLSSGGSLPAEPISQPLQAASSASIRLEPGAASMTLAAGSDANLLISGKVASPVGLKAEQKFSVSAGTATYALTQTGGTVNFLPTSRSNWAWDLEINKNIPIDLTVKMGAGNADLRLTGLNLNNLSVDMGVGQVILTLPDQGNFKVNVNGAVGQLVVFVPQDLGVRITSNTGLATVNVPSDFQKNGDISTSPNYNSAQNQVNLVLSQAIGNISIRDQANQ